MVLEETHIWGALLTYRRQGRLARCRAVSALAGSACKLFESIGVRASLWGGLLWYLSMTDPTLRWFPVTLLTQGTDVAI
jgi:hypothetical protein